MVRRGILIDWWADRHWTTHTQSFSQNHFNYRHYNCIITIIILLHLLTIIHSPIGRYLLSESRPPSNIESSPSIRLHDRPHSIRERWIYTSHQSIGEYHLWGADDGADDGRDGAAGEIGEEIQFLRHEARQLDLHLPLLLLVVVTKDDGDDEYDADDYEWWV